MITLLTIGEVRMKVVAWNTGRFYVMDRLDTYLRQHEDAGIATAIARLREAGYAVAIVPPQDLKDISAREIEKHMQDAGHRAIDMWSDA